MHERRASSNLILHSHPSPAARKARQAAGSAQPLLQVRLPAVICFLDLNRYLDRSFFVLLRL